MRHGWATTVIFSPGFLNTLPGLCSPQLKNPLIFYYTITREQKIKYREHVVRNVVRVTKWLSQRKEEEVSREELKHLRWGRGRTEVEMGEGQDRGRGPTPFSVFFLSSEGALAYIPVSSQ